MDAIGVIRHLIEEPEETPQGMDLDAPDLGRYAAPVSFDMNVRQILDYARQLKEQAEQAGAFGMLAGYRPEDIDRAFLIVAVQKYNEEFVVPPKIAKILRREMHSIWD